MAIIRLDCNLNGGDSVTPNNELFYRIYGDVDAYAAPIHTTGTALSDANVTVNNDNVIITGVDGGANTEFKIAAVDGAGNEGILSDAVSGSIILFEDLFPDPSVDTTKWDIVNPNAGATQSIIANELRLGGTINAVTPYQADYLLGKTGYDLSSTHCFAFDTKVIDNANASAGIGISEAGPTDPLVNSCQTVLNATPDQIGAFGVSNSSVFMPNVFHPKDLSAWTSFRWRIEGGTVYFEIWDGSWTVLDSASQDLSGVTWYPFIAFRDQTAQTGWSFINNYRVTSANYSAQYPE